LITVGGYRLKENKRLLSELRKIFGIGLNKANQILYCLNLSKNTFIKNINYSNLIKLNKIIIHYVHGLRAKRNLKNSIILLFENKCYRGVRHSYFLSVRGQRTRTNAKTQRNKKNKKNKKKKKNK
jgi:small subunit ribosomal protein S13